MNLSITSTLFLVLLPVAVAVYYIVPRPGRKFFLLLINLLFYASFGWQFTFVLIAESVVAWGGARLIETTQAGGKSALPLTCCAIILPAATLIFFKFGSLLTDSIVAPLGISFYTLQAISYVVDVKKRAIAAEKNYFDTLVYLSFFPTITSGPIYRYQDFLPEHRRNERELRADYENIVNAIVYVLYGYFLKFVLVARVGGIVDTIYGNAAQFSGWTLLLAPVAYSVQLYADFAGYSAIVIGIARMLGYKVPENFLAPYLSGSIKEFWSRWHISLSSWLKDYIYVPLGGNRKGKARKYLNILITFIVSGIWHGVSGFHFVIWGLMHGLYQIVGELLKPFRERLSSHLRLSEGSAPLALLRRLWTFSLVTVAWIFFRTETGFAVDYIVRMVTSLGAGVPSGFASLELAGIEWVVILCSTAFMVFVDVILYRKRLRFDELVISHGVLLRWLVIVILSLVILVFGKYGSQHGADYFIYRDF